MVRRLSSKQIIELLREYKDKIQHFKVKKIGLFGSFLKGTANSKSDIDLLVEFETTTFDNYMDLKFFLERLFKRKVDLVIESNLKKQIQYVKEEAVYVS